MTAVRAAYPNLKIFLWTGYEFEELLSSKDDVVNSILEKIDTLIVGRFEEEKMDLTLALRGSTNQMIWERDNESLWEIVNKKYDES